MTLKLTPPHHDLTFMAPLGPARADSLVRFLADGLASTAQSLVVDTGCGWGELLLRVLEGTPHSVGLGLDLDHDAIDCGQWRARQRGLSERVELVCEEACSRLPVSADAAICIGASQIWGPPVEQAQPLDYAAALRALRALLPRGGRLVFGESIWSQPPTPRAIAPLAGREDEYVTLEELLEIAIGCGFTPVRAEEANQDEWDQFESGNLARYTRWLSEHGAEHPDRLDVAQRAERQRSDYFDGYRGVLGFAYLNLIAA